MHGVLLCKYDSGEEALFLQCDWSCLQRSTSRAGSGMNEGKTGDPIFTTESCRQPLKPDDPLFPSVGSCPVNLVSRVIYCSVYNGNRFFRIRAHEDLVYPSRECFPESSLPGNDWNVIEHLLSLSYIAALSVSFVEFLE